MKIIYVIILLFSTLSVVAGERLVVLSTVVSAWSSAHRPGSAAHQYGMNFDFGLNLSLNNAQNATLNFGINKRLDHYRQESLSDPSLGWSYQFIDEEYWSVKGSLKGIYPLSESSRKTRTLKVAFIGKINGGIDLKPVGLKYCNLFWGISGFKKFHEYKVGHDGGVNTSGGMEFTLGLSYSPLEWLVATIGGNVSGSFSYYGSMNEPVYGMFQGLDFILDENLNLSVSHSHGGNLYSSNGVESNFELFDLDTSQYSASLVKRF
jgi:hypothetical protein